MKSLSLSLLEIGEYFFQISLSLLDWTFLPLVTQCEAVPHLRHIVVSLLRTLLNIEEEAVSCLLGVIEVDVQTGDGDVGEV